MATAERLSQSIEDQKTASGLPLLTARDAAYDEARRIHNGLIDRRPAAIMRCRGTADIAAAISLARELGLEVSIRGGGHNVAGRAVAEGGLMIDLSAMRGVLVDAAARTARVQGGATWADVNRETQLHGLATTGGVVSTTGVAGLTLGGGLGWLMPKYGMALDNLRSAEVVTAEGKVLTASARENDDLFWAIRGGGGNFGVVASFEFALHPVGPTVYGGLAAHPLAKAREVLQFYREQTRSLPDEVMAFCAMVHAPDGSGAKLAALVVAHCGDPKAGEAALKPFKAFGPPVLDTIGPIPYTAVNSMLDAGFPKGALNYWKSSFLRELSDDAIAALVEGYAQCPAPMANILLENFHGAACRVAADATAFVHRIECHNLAVLGQWADPAQSEACVAWTRKTYDSVRPVLAGRRYVNYLGDDEAGAEAEAYGQNLARLQKIKARYDPGNFFHHNQNIRPAA